MFLHHTAYSCANGLASLGSDWNVRSQWGPLSEFYGVDVVFTGHDRIYERSRYWDEFLADGSAGQDGKGDHLRDDRRRRSAARISRQRGFGRTVPPAVVWQQDVLPVARARMSWRTLELLQLCPLLVRGGQDPQRLPVGAQGSGSEQQCVRHTDHHLDSTQPNSDDVADPDRHPDDHHVSLRLRHFDAHAHANADAQPNPHALGNSHCSGNSDVLAEPLPNRYANRVANQQHDAKPVSLRDGYANWLGNAGQHGNANPFRNRHLVAHADAIAISYAVPVIHSRCKSDATVTRAPSATSSPTGTETGTPSPTPSPTVSPSPAPTTPARCQESGFQNPCVPGGGSRRTDCWFEFAVTGELQRDRSGMPRRKVVCFEGDPRCDRDSDLSNMRCAFELRLCINNQDPRLPLCFAGSLTAVDLRHAPDPLVPDPDRSNLLALEAMCGSRPGGLGLTVFRRGVLVTNGSPNADRNRCSDPLGITVPLRVSSESRLSPATRRLHVSVLSSSSQVDTDRLVSQCRPSTCGNGVVEPDHESCDDGNRLDGDGCHRGCHWE